MTTHPDELAEYRNFLTNRRSAKNANRRGPRSLPTERRYPRLTWTQLDQLTVGADLQLNTSMRKPRRRIVGQYLEHTDNHLVLDTQDGEMTVRRNSVREIVDRTAVGRFRVNDAVVVAPSLERAVVIDVDAPMVRVMREADLNDPDFHIGRLGWVHEDELRSPSEPSLPRAHPGTAGDFVVEASRETAREGA